MEEGSSTCIISMILVALFSLYQNGSNFFTISIECETRPKWTSSPRCKMVAFDFSHSHRHGRCRSSQFALRHGLFRMGTGDLRNGTVVVCDPAHYVANHAASRMCPRSSFRPLYRPREVRFRAETGALSGPAAAAGGSDRVRYSVHGNGRELSEEIFRNRLLRLEADEAILLDLHLWRASLLSLSAAGFQLRHRRFCCSRNHVTLLLDDSVGGEFKQGAIAGSELRIQEGEERRSDFQSVQRLGSGHFRIRRPRRGAGDSGDDSVDSGEAVEGTHVERRRLRVLRQRALLFSGGHDRLLGFRAGRRRQRPRGARKAAVAHRRRKLDGGRPRRRKLSGLRDAGFRHHGENRDEEIQRGFVIRRDRPPQDSPSIVLRRFHSVHGSNLPILRRSPRFLRWIWLCSHFLLPPEHNLVEGHEAAEIQQILDHKLGMHILWDIHHVGIHHWRPEKYCC